MLDDPCRAQPERPVLAPGLGPAGRRRLPGGRERDASARRFASRAGSSASGRRSGPTGRSSWMPRARAASSTFASCSGSTTTTASSSAALRTIDAARRDGATDPRLAARPHRDGRPIAPARRRRPTDSREARTCRSSARSSGRARRQLDGLHAAPTCQELGAFSPAQLARHDLGARRASALVRICRAVELERLKQLPTDAAADRLGRERGLGPWSVGVVCLEGLGRFERGLLRDLGLIKLASELWGRRVEAEEADALLAPYGEWAGPRQRLSARRAAPGSRTLAACPSRPELHVSDDPAAAVARLLADQAARGGSIVLTGRLDTAPRVRARGSAGAGLGSRHALVGRRAVRPARQRAVELPPRSRIAARPDRGSRRRGAPDPRRAAAGRRLRTPSTRSWPVSSSTCCCSGSAPTATWPRSFQARPSSSWPTAERPAARPASNRGSTG